MAFQAKFKDRHTRISQATFAKVAVNGTAREQQESSGVRSLLSQQGKPLGSLSQAPLDRDCLHVAKQRTVSVTEKPQLPAARLSPVTVGM